MIISIPAVILGISYTDMSTWIEPLVSQRVSVDLLLWVSGSGAPLACRGRRVWLTVIEQNKEIQIGRTGAAIFIRSQPCSQFV